MKKEYARVRQQQVLGNADASLLPYLSRGTGRLRCQESMISVLYGTVSPDGVWHSACRCPLQTGA